MCEEIPTQLDVSQRCAYIHTANRLIDDLFLFTWPVQ